MPLELVITKIKFNIIVFNQNSKEHKNISLLVDRRSYNFVSVRSQVADIQNPESKWDIQANNKL